MWKTTISSLSYCVVAALANVIGWFVWEAIPVTAYRMVTVFIVLIILSNCLAKLFLLHVYKQQP
jgi:hypothetical protein